MQYKCSFGTASLTTNESPYAQHYDIPAGNYNKVTVDQTSTWNSGYRKGAADSNFVINDLVDFSGQNYSFSFKAREGGSYSLVMYYFQTSGNFIGISPNWSINVSGADAKWNGTAPDLLQYESKSDAYPGGGTVIVSSAMIGCGMTGDCTVSIDFGNNLSAGKLYVGICGVSG